MCWTRSERFEKEKSSQEPLGVSDQGQWQAKPGLATVLLAVLESMCRLVKIKIVGTELVQGQIYNCCIIYALWLPG
jgi:hypothetical protein